MEMQREPEFQETVYYIRDLIAEARRGKLTRCGSGKYIKAAFAEPLEPARGRRRARCSRS